MFGGALLSFLFSAKGACLCIFPVEIKKSTARTLAFSESAPPRNSKAKTKKHRTAALHCESGIIRIFDASNSTGWDNHRSTSEVSATRQIVYKTSIPNNINGNGAPAFLFERQKSANTNPAVVEIP